MKKQHLFTLDIDLIRDLHRRVGRGHRSQFVETAVRNRLNNEEEYTIDDVDSQRLAAMFYNRLCNQSDDTPLCGIMRNVLSEWISQ